MQRREFLRNELLPEMAELVNEAEQKKTAAIFFAFFEAVKQGALKDVRYFVNKKSIDVNTKNEDDKTPLHLAIELGKIKIVKFLLSKGAAIGDKTPLHLAIELGKIKIVKFLLSKGAAIDGKTPLHLAVELGKIQVVKSLASKGADVDAKNVDGKTPLHLAASLGKMGIVKILVYKWADIDAKDGANLTPLHLAVLGGYDDIAKFLAANGANVRITDELHDWSMKNENMSIIEWTRHYELIGTEDFSKQEF